MTWTDDVAWRSQKVPRGEEVRVQWRVTHQVVFVPKLNQSNVNLVHQVKTRGSHDMWCILVPHPASSLQHYSFKINSQIKPSNSWSDVTSSTHLPNTQRKKKTTSRHNKVPHRWRSGAVDSSCTFLRRHFIELSRRHLQETPTASGIPEPPPHPLSALIRPLHVYNTPAAPRWRYSYSYGKQHSSFPVKEGSMWDWDEKRRIYTSVRIDREGWVCVCRN